MSRAVAGAVAIRTEFIRLDQFLKLADAVSGGGEAKVRVQAGEVRVNGQVETRRGRKLRPGDEVAVDGRCLRVVAAT
ncbi:MAG: RNA-binding S4 domain-containing protein [Proteobacteria bacterium]|nr:RNA-binding S4 domain-containing protein [Pseudomonadota bacterium]